MKKFSAPSVILFTIAIILATAGFFVNASSKWVFFIAFFLWVFASLLILVSLLLTLMRSGNKKLRSCSRIILIALLSATGVGLISFVIVEGILVSESYSEADKPAKYAVVLGAGLDGDRPTLALWHRLRAAEDYLARNPETIVIVSGGQGENELISEAEAMSRYLKSAGIDPDRIIEEDRATSTEENFFYTRAIISELEGGDALVRIAVVTNEFHMARSKILARRYNFTPISVPCPSGLQSLKLANYLREYFAFINTYFRLGFTK